MTEQEKFRHNLVYVLNMLKNKNYTRKEIIKELQKELERFDCNAKVVIPPPLQMNEDGCWK